MTTLTLIKTTGRAAIVAMALGATALSAMPAQAASPQGSFTLQMNGPNGGVQFGNEDGRYHDKGRYDRNGASISFRFGSGYRYHNFCLTNGQIESQLEKRGFRNADVVRNLKNDRVLVVAKFGGRWYELRVDRCSGRVDKVKPLKLTKKGGFSFTITF